MSRAAPSVNLIRTLLFTLLLGTPAYAQLNGTYTIGGTTPDYATISVAVADLNSMGTSGPVTFIIRAGTYDEQVTINSFTRTGNPEDLVTFQRPNNTVTVTWQYTAATAATNWVARLDGASYIRFLGISFEATAPSPTGRLLVYDNHAHHIRVRNCTFTGHLGVTSDAGSLVYQNSLTPGNYPGNTFKTSTFTWGYRGIDWSPLGGLNSFDMQVFGNTFGGQYDAGPYLGAVEDAVVDSNYVLSAAWSDTNYLGIYVAGSTSDTSGPNASITRNEIDMQIGGTGLWLFGGGDNYVANNLIAQRYSLGDQGVYIAAGNVEFYHNTVRTTGADADAIFVSSSTSGHIIKNNIFSADGGAIAMHIGGDRDSYEADYNNFYTTGATVVRVDGTDYATLEEYRNGELGTDDDHSTGTAVTFVDIVGANDLHLAAPSNNDVALLTPQVAGITTDFDDDVRSIYNVYKGADEGMQILPMDNADTASGFYTVGGTTPDFPHPNNAVFNLHQRGIKGEVTFRIRAGTYTVHRNLRFTRFTGPNAHGKEQANELVLFRAANLANRPALQYGASGTEDNWVLRLQEVDFVSFHNLDFQATGPAPYGRVIELEGEGVQNITFDGCTFTGVTGETGTSAALVYGRDFEQHNLTFQNNTLTDGSYGLYLTDQGGVGTRGSETLVEGNTFNEQETAGVYIDHQVISLKDNIVNSALANTIGFQVNSGEAGSVFDREIIVGNQMNLTGLNSKGIELTESHGFTTGQAQMKNNFIRTRHIGVEMKGNSRLYKIYHNTIRARDLTLYLTDTGADIEILNNMLINTSTGAALHVEEAADVDITDYNVIRNDGGGTLVHWDGANHANLTAYQNASGMDLNSINTSVTFVDPANGDLHLTGASDGDSDLAGTPLLDVTDDIDGDTRSLGAPYKGADEAGTALGFDLTLDVLLDGPYDGANPGTMLTGLNDNDVLPFDQPYNTAPWNYAGTENFDLFFITNNADVVDWVLLQILSGDPLNPPMTVEGEMAILLRSDGRIIQNTLGTSSTDAIGFAIPPGAYYVAVDHRNHLSIMSATPVDFTSGSATYDFTDALAKAYTGGGTAMRDRADGFFTMWGGDGDVNGSTTAFDFLNVWLPINGGPLGYEAGDFDMNGSATAFDFLNVWLPANGQASQVPN